MIPGIVKTLLFLSSCLQPQNIGMYTVFDNFLMRRTWHLQLDRDQELLLRSLHQVVGRDTFNPDEFGRYMDSKREIGQPAQAVLPADVYNEARTRYVLLARTIQHYVRLGLAN